MIDEQIIQALELCFSENFGKCEICPLEKQRDEVFTCIKTKQKNALDLINRQRAEIERLQKEKAKIHKLIPKMIKEAKSEAINELVKRLKDRVVKKYKYTDVRIFNEIDNLVKEMTEPTRVEHSSLCETETYKG